MNVTTERSMVFYNMTGLKGDTVYKAWVYSVTRAGRSETHSNPLRTKTARRCTKPLLYNFFDLRSCSYRDIL